MALRVKSVRIKGLKSKYRVTVYGVDGSYALSVPQTRLGKLLLPVAREQPIVVSLKKSVEVPVENLKGVKPLKKAARRFGYTPIRSRKKAVAKQHEMEATAKAVEFKPPEEVTSAVPPKEEAAAKPKRRARKKQEVVA